MKTQKVLLIITDQIFSGRLKKVCNLLKRLLTGRN